MTSRSARRLALWAIVTLVGMGGAALWLWPRPSLEPAVTLLAAGRPAEAERLVRRFLEASPHDAQAHYLLAVIEYQRLDESPPSSPTEILSHLRQVPNSDKKRAARARYMEGMVCDRLSRLDEAESAWKTALELDPSATDAGWELNRLYDRQARRADGRALVLRLYRADPAPQARLKALMELVRQDVHQPAAAGLIGFLSPIVAANPADVQSALALGRALCREGKTDDGLALLRKQVETHPDRREGWESLLTSLEDSGQVDALVQTLALVPRLPDSTTWLARYEGRAAQERGDWKTAANAYRRALAADPHNLKVAYRLIRVLRLGGSAAEAERLERTTHDEEAARKELRALYETAEKEVFDGAPHPEIYQQFAALRERMGRRDDAYAWHSLVLLDRPSDPLSLAAIERLKVP
jgi:tetratricopeptide (TPR) repeat protein